MRRVRFPRRKKDVVAAVAGVLEVITGIEGSGHERFVWTAKVGSRQCRDVIAAKDEEQIQRAIKACNFEAVSIVRYEEPSAALLNKRKHDKAYQKGRRDAAKNASVETVSNEKRWEKGTPLAELPDDEAAFQGDGGNERGIPPEPSRV